MLADERAEVAAPEDFAVEVIGGQGQILAIPTGKVDSFPVGRRSAGGSVLRYECAPSCPELPSTQHFAAGRVQTPPASVRTRPLTPSGRAPGRHKRWATRCRYRAARPPDDALGGIPFHGHVAVVSGSVTVWARKRGQSPPPAGTAPSSRLPASRTPRRHSRRCMMLVSAPVGSPQSTGGIISDPVRRDGRPVRRTLPRRVPELVATASPSGESNQSKRLK